MLHTSTRRGLLFEMRVVIAEKAAKETSIIFDVRIGRPWETVGINPITIRLIILAIPRIVNQESIGSGRTADDNAIHSMRLMLGALKVSAKVMMEVAKGEYQDPCALVVTDSVNQKKGGRQETGVFARDCVHHPSRVCDGIKPESSGHLLLGEVGPSHVNHYFPMRLDETVGGLTFSRSRDNLRWVAHNEFINRSTEQLQVAVRVECTCKGTSRSLEKPKGRDNARRHKIFEAEGPVVASCTVNYDQGIAETTDRDSISKSNIHMHGIKEAVPSPINGTTSVGLGNRSI